jgi:hypothetical protein
MSKVMKVEFICFLVLKIFGYFCGTVGTLSVFGFAGSLESSTITATQFWLYELHAFGLIALAFVIYYIREVVREDFIRRDSYLHHNLQFGTR